MSGSPINTLNTWWKRSRKRCWDERNAFRRMSQRTRHHVQLLQPEAISYLLYIYVYTQRNTCRQSWWDRTSTRQKEKFNGGGYEKVGAAGLRLFVWSALVLEHLLSWDRARQKIEERVGERGQQRDGRTMREAQSRESLHVLGTLRSL